MVRMMLLLLYDGEIWNAIKEGADRLGWTLDEVLDKTILAMRSCESAVADELATLTE